MRLGVAGWPVAQSRSPAMQNAALAAAGLTGWRYQLLPIPPCAFDETVAALPERGFKGINVTIPHKERALELALAGGGEVSARAAAIGAANTLVFDPSGAIRADNTDAPALIGALGRPAAGLTAVVLGAGGSARAAVWALLDAGAAQVSVWNRTPERARALCEALGGGTVVADPPPADLLVNCTSIGLHAGAGAAGAGAAGTGAAGAGAAGAGAAGAGGAGAAERDVAELAALPVGASELQYGIVVDLVYREGGTALLRRAREQGLETVGGLELLIGQGALSFEQFTGVPSNTAAMRSALGLQSMAR